MYVHTAQGARVTRRATTMRSTMIENVKQNVQFAFGGHDGHALKTPTLAVVTRKDGTYLLHLHVGSKDASTTEVRRDQRILVDYKAEGAKVCGKDAEHGAKIAYPAGNLYCKPCFVKNFKEAAARRKAARAEAGDPTALRMSDEDARAEARRKIAEAKIDRLMLLLESKGLALHQQQDKKVSA